MFLVQEKRKGKGQKELTYVPMPGRKLVDSVYDGRDFQMPGLARVRLVQ